MESVRHIMGNKGSRFALNALMLSILAGVPLHGCSTQNGAPSDVTTAPASLPSSQFGSTEPSAKRQPGLSTDGAYPPEDLSSDRAGSDHPQHERVAPEPAVAPIEAVVEAAVAEIPNIPNPWPGAVLLDDLQKAFDEDAFAASRRYGGEKITFRAQVVHPVDPSGFGGRLQVGGLSDPKGVETLNIVVADLARGELPGAEKLYLSQEVVLEGMCFAQDNFLKVLQFGECRIRHAGPDPCVPVTAEGLTRAFIDEDGEQIERVWKKPVLVSGVVQALDPEDIAIHLSGSTDAEGRKVKVKFYLGIDGWKKVKGKVNPGDRVKVRGLGPRYDERLAEVTLSHGRLAE